MPPQSGATSGSPALVGFLPVVNQPRRLDVLERLFPCQKALSEKRGLSGRWKDAHLVAIGPDSVLLKVYAALVRTPPSGIIPQLSAVFLNDDHPRSGLEDYSGIAPFDQPLQLGLRLERKPAKIGEAKRVPARRDAHDRLERL